MDLALALGQPFNDYVIELYEKKKKLLKIIIKFFAWLQSDPLEKNK